MATKSDGKKTAGSARKPAQVPTVTGGQAAPAGAAADAPKKPFNPYRFYKEVRQEMRKITWTSRSETWITTVMVFIMVVLAALFFSVTDWVLGTGLEWLVRLTGAASGS